MARLFANNFLSSIANPIASNALSMALAAGDGARLPTLGQNDYLLLTLYEGAGANESNHEIVRVTAINGDSLTIVRGREGTVARAWPADTPVALRVTAAGETNPEFRTVTAEDVTVTGNLTAENLTFNQSTVETLDATTVNTQNLSVATSASIASLSLDNPLDITSGGTGANTASDARLNLDVYSTTEANDLFVNSTGTVALSGPVTGSAQFNGDDVTVTTTIADNAVALGQQTTGNYVSNVTLGVAGGLLVEGTAGEGATFSVSHANTSDQGDVTNTGTTFLQSIGFDAFGHVTSVASATVNVGNGAVDILSGAGLTGSGSFTLNQATPVSITLSHGDTSTQADVVNNGNNFIQSLDFDEFGHVVGVTSGAVTAAASEQVLIESNNATDAVHYPLFVDGANGARTANTDDEYTYNPATNTLTVANFAGNATTASTLQTGRNISLQGDVEGTATFDGSQNVVINATISPNSVALGTDTTGNYVADLAGTANRIIVTGGGVENATVTVNVDATSLPTPNKVVARDINGASEFESLTVNTEVAVTGGSIILGGTGRIQGIDTVTASTDAANKQYVDDLVAGTGVDAATVEDIVGAMVTDNVELGIAVTYDATNRKLDFDVNDFSVTLSGDVTGTATVTNLGNINISTVVTDDSHNHTSSTGDYNVGGNLMVTGGVITLGATGRVQGVDEVIDPTDATSKQYVDDIAATILSGAEVEDIVGQMVTGNLENGIAVTFDNVGRKLDFDVNDPVITLSGDVTGSGTLTNLADLTIPVTVNQAANATTADSANTATTADRWTTARTITLDGDASGNVSIDGSANVTLTTTVSNAATAGSANTANTADRWTTARTITLDGDASGNVSIDGSANVTLTTTVSNAANATTADSATTAGSANTANTADRWTTARTITLGGDASGNVSIDGSANVTLTATVSNAATAGNANTLDGLDSTQFLRSDAADTATGDLTFARVTSNGRVTSRINTTTGAINLSLGNYFTASNTQNTTYSFNNPIAGQLNAFVLRIDHLTGTITFPNTVRWPEGQAPTLITGREHVFSFLSQDNGATWYGVAMPNY